MTLWTVVSRPGEPLDDFMTRTARQALVVLASSPATICGQVEDASGTQRIVLMTTRRAADCSAAGSTHPYLLVNRATPGTPGICPSRQELDGPVYVADPSGVRLERGTSSRQVARFGER